MKKERKVHTKKIYIYISLQFFQSILKGRKIVWNVSSESIKADISAENLQKSFKNHKLSQKNFSIDFLNND